MSSGTAEIATGARRRRSGGVDRLFRRTTLFFGVAALATTGLGFQYSGAAATTSAGGLLSSGKK